MNDRILQKYTGRSSERIIDAGAAEECETTSDLGAFGWLPGTRDRGIMLELRKKNGNVLAIGYGWLERVDFDPSDGITLHMVGQKIRIKGRNLNGEVRPDVRLFQGITQHKVTWIQEADGPTALQAGRSGTVIEKIEW